jgi:predicted DNA-binding transcriptional regulator AlpA
MTEGERLWTLAETAAYLSVPERTLYAWRGRGEGPAAARVGRYLRFDPAVVRRWVADRTEQSPGRPVLAALPRAPSLRKSGHRSGRSAEAPSAGRRLDGQDIAGL